MIVFNIPKAIPQFREKVKTFNFSMLAIIYIYKCIYIYIYVHIYLSAFGKRPRATQACKQPSNRATKQPSKPSKISKKTNNNEPKFCKQSTKIVSKIHQVGSKNPPSWSPKSSKMGALGRLGGVWGPSWAILDHLGPKMAPRAHKDLQKLIVRPPLDPPSWSQNRPKIDLEAIQNVISFLIGCWIDI